LIDHQSRRDEILDAAEKRYFRTGYKKTTLAEVAGDVGLVKSAIYKHFQNKEKLFDAVLSRLIDSVMNRSAAVVAEKATAAEKLTALMMCSYDEVLELHYRFKASPEVWHDLRPHIMRVDRQYFNQFIDKVAVIIELGVADWEMKCKSPKMVGTMVHMLFSSLHELIFLGEINPNDGYEYIKFSVDTILNGLLVKGS